MQPSTKLSVIMSCFNSSETVAESIESVLNQTYKNFEFLICDDNSTDDTYSIIQKYSNLDSRIICYRNNTNLGLTKSLNILLKKSRFSIIARQDADDISYKNRFQLQLNYLFKKNLDLVSCLTIKNGRTIPNISRYLPIKFTLRYKNPIIHGSIIVKKDVIKKVNYYDEYFKFAQDYKLICDLILNDKKVGILKKVLYFSNSINNISQTFYKEQMQFADEIKNYYRENIN